MLPPSRHRLLATAASVTLMLAACGDGGGDDSNTPCSSLDIMREAQSLTADEASCILALHNAARASVTPAADPPLEPLQWDGGLAGAASAYAQTCPTVPATDGHGENLWKGTAGHFTIADAVNKWVSQKQWFTYGQPCAAPAGEYCGHYTQIVWAPATKVGCGYAKCDGDIIVACNYDKIQSGSDMPY